MENTIKEALLEHISEIANILDEDNGLGEDLSIIKELAYELKDEIEAIDE